MSEIDKLTIILSVLSIILDSWILVSISDVEKGINSELDSLNVIYRTLNNVGDKDA